MARSRLLAAVVLLGVVWASSNLEAQPKKGLDALAAGDYEQAITIFKAAAQGGSKKDRLANYYFLGMAYYQIKQLPEAIAALEESLKHVGDADKLTANAWTIGCYGQLGQADLDKERHVVVFVQELLEIAEHLRNLLRRRRDKGRFGQRAARRSDPVLAAP